MATPGLRVDQVSSAIAASAGVRWSVSQSASTDYYVTNSSYEDINAEFTKTFNVAVAGQYNLQVPLSVFFTSGTGLTAVQYRLVFDAGTGSEQTIGGGVSYEIGAVTYGQRFYRQMTGTITLTAGTHTVKFQWRRAFVFDSGVPHIDGGDFLAIVGVLVTGSGVGGIVPTTRDLLSDFSVTGTISPSAEQEVTELASTVVTTANERVLVVFTGRGRQAGSGFTAMYWQLRVDGTTVYFNTVNTNGDLEQQNLSFSFLTDQLSAGSHTIKLYVAKYDATNQDWTLTAGGGVNGTTNMQIIQFRGGLVPVQKDGSDVATQPRAMNFIGSGVSVSEVTGVATVQLNEALTVPGETKTILSFVPGGNVDLTSDSFVDLTGASNTFSLTSKGTYLLLFEAQCFATVGTSESTGFRLVFDVGTGSEQIIGPDSSSWRIFHNQASEQHPNVFVVPVTFSASGSHTVKVQWKRALATANTHRMDVNGYAYVQLMLAAGSGAGGTLASQIQVTGINTYSGASWQNLLQASGGSALSLTVDASAGENILCNLVLSCQNSTGTDDWADFRIYMDGTTEIGWVRQRFFDANHDENVGITAFAQNVTAGSHTFTAQIYVNGSMVITQHFGTNRGKLEVIRYRGGLVPIRKDGASIVDTPAAIEFTGPGCQVTNVGGTAKVSITGADGVAPTTARSILTQTVSGLQTPTFSPTYFSDIETNVMANEGEYFLVTMGEHWANLQTVGYSSAYIGFLVDSASSTKWMRAFRFQAQWDQMAPTLSVVVGPLTAGLHNFKPWGSKYAADSADWVCCYPYIDITRIKGGFVQPENLPILEKNSDSQIHLHAAPGCSTELRATLNDGKVYTAQAPLVIDLTVSGRGGLDTGSEAASTWYYAYLVPNSAGTGLSALCSVTSPATGPTGYSIWRYAGPFRNDGSSNIIKVLHHSGNVFQYTTVKELADSSSLGTSFKDPIISLSVTDVVPLTASNVTVWHRIRRTGSTTGLILQAVYAYGETTAITSCRPPAVGSVGYDDQGVSTGVVPLDSNMKVDYLSRSESGSPTMTVQSVLATGWVDGYLGPRTSQIQAKYVPDTPIPWITRAGDGSISVAAGPARPSTILVTLQDGKQRYCSGTLTFDFANGVADLGLDTGAEASSTWYYMYLVPKTGDDNQLSIRASVTMPSTGPTGYTNFRYIGPFYNNSSSQIYNFHQRSANEFFWPFQREPATVAAFGTTFQDPKVEVSIIDVCSPTASVLFGSCNIGVGTASAGYSLLQEIYGYGQTNLSFNVYVAAQDQYERSFSGIIIPVYLSGTTPMIGYKSAKDGGTITINHQHFFVNGFVDRFIW